MSGKLYFGRPWNEPGYPDPWISFEDNLEFSLTGAKSKFCQACLLALKKGLLSYEWGQGISIGSGVSCWKAVVSIEGLKDTAQAQRLLEEYQDDFLPEESGIHGKVGGGEIPGQQQIMMHCDSPLEADAYKEATSEWLRKHHNHPLNSYSAEQGCKHPFLELFGPVSHRKEVMAPKSLEAVRTVLDVYLQDPKINRF